METGRNEIQEIRERLSLMLEQGLIGVDLEGQRRKKSIELVEAMMIFVEEFCWLYRMHDVESGMLSRANIPILVRIEGRA